MAFRTSNQAWLKGLDTGTYCRLKQSNFKLSMQLFSQKNLIMRIFGMSGWFAIPIKWSFTVSAQPNQKWTAYGVSKAHMRTQKHTFCSQYQHSQTATPYIRRNAANAHETWQLRFSRQMCLVYLHTLQVKWGRCTQTHSLTLTSGHYIYSSLHYEIQIQLINTTH